MFRDKDYVPFMCGIFILGGLFLIPIIWGGLSEIEYQEAIIPSLISCGVFAYAHDKKGNFSVWKLLIGMFVVFVIIFRTSLGSGGLKRPMFLAGGILGYILMSLCGWAGIWIGRLIRGKEQVAGEAAEEEKAALSVPAVGIPVPAGEKVVALGDTAYDQFIAASYNAWRAGRMDALSSAFRKEATEKSLKDYSALYRQYQGEIETAVAVRPFEEDEYLVACSKKVFVMTSKAIYMLKGSVQTIALKDIQAYTTRGFWNVTAHITLKDGRKLVYPKLEAAPKNEFVDALKC